MFKKIVIVIVVILAIIAAALFIYRYQILKYTTETLIRKYLPDYIRIDTISFDFRKGEAVFRGFKVLNPAGFSESNLIEIEKITCGYKLRGNNIIDGIEISGPELTGAVLNIERLGNGKLNLAEAGTLMDKGHSVPSAGMPAVGGEEERRQEPLEANRRLAGLVKLPESFTIKNAKAIFVDRLSSAKPTVITFENIDSDLTMKMDEYYTKFLSITSVGKGEIAGDRTQVVRWNIGLNPSAPRLTMSSRFDVSGVLITPFRPYYDKYSPLVITAGKFSGLLIFDFDNGMIGSSNELRLAGLKFYVKPGYENAQFLETTVPDLVKYFTSPYGEIVFDFKIKGDIAEPRFLLGPKSKKAIIAMAVDKISDAIQKSSQQGGGPKSDMEKAKDYIDLFQGLLKK